MRNSRRDFLNAAALAVASGESMQSDTAFAAKRKTRTARRGKLGPWLRGTYNPKAYHQMTLPKTGVKIKSIETFTRGDVSIVRLTTDDGSQGYGQISICDADISAIVMHRKIARHALGKEPADIETIVDRCMEANHKYPWSYVCRALSGLDTAERQISERA